MTLASVNSNCLPVYHIWNPGTKPNVAQTAKCWLVMHRWTSPSRSLHPIISPLKSGQGCFMSLSCLESQGCHLIPLSYLISFFCLDSSCSFCLVIFLLMVHSPDFFSFFFFFFRKLKYFSLRVWLFCMALVEQLGDGRWYVELAAIYMALIFAIMHLYIYFLFIFYILYCICPFLFLFLFL